MANYVRNKESSGLMLPKVTSIFWITLVLSQYVAALDLGPSEESIRQYLALYERQRQLRRLKPYQIDNPIRPNFPDDEALTREMLGRNANIERVPQYYKPRESWPAQDIYPPRTPSDWYGNSQSEIGLDEEAIENQNEPNLNVGLRGSSKQKNDISRSEPKSSTGYVYSDTISNSVKEKKSPQQIVGENTPNLPMAHSQIGFETESKNPNPLADIYFVVIVAGCSAASIVGVIAAGFCFYRVQKNSKAAAEVDYPAYGVTGPSKEHATSPSGDRRLAQSAQMYHYQHQKQAMIAVEKATTVRNASASDVDSEEENEEGDYTVYECPGLASTGEMEVKNPLFHDDSTPVSPPLTAKETVQKP